MVVYDVRDIESIVASFTGCGGRLQLRDTIPPDAFDARSLSDGKRFSILQVGFDDFHGMRACLQEQLPEQARGICRREPVLLGAAMLGFDAIGLDVDPLPAFRQGSPDRFRSPFSCTNDSDSHRFTLTHTQNHDRIRASFVSRFSRRPPR